MAAKRSIAIMVATKQAISRRHVLSHVYSKQSHSRSFRRLDPLRFMKYIDILMFTGPRPLTRSIKARHPIRTSATDRFVKEMIEARTSEFPGIIKHCMRTNVAALTATPPSALASPPVTLKRVELMLSLLDILSFLRLVSPGLSLFLVCPSCK